MLAPGDHVVVPDDAYGGTYRLVARVAGPWGVEHTPAHLADLDAVRAAVRPGVTRLVWVETPTNPLLGIADIAALAEIAHAAGALLVVDNTFATPYLQNPLALGADVVVHSTTKYAGGHSDVVGGALVVRDGRERALAGRRRGRLGRRGRAGRLPPERDGRGRRAVRRLAGAARAEDPRRADGTALRQRRADRGRVPAATTPGCGRCSTPGLPEHPGHEVAARQMRRFGGMVSFRLVGGEEDALNVCKRTEVFTLGESLGGVESLIEHPGRMTHASVAGSALEVPADLVRLSVGLEDVEDLLADLDRALA